MKVSHHQPPLRRRPLALSVRRRRWKRGFSLLEVLVALTIFLTGVVAIVGLFPLALQSNQRTMDVSVAAYLAQMKAEEIRRDDHFFGGNLISGIEAMTEESTPLTFPQDQRFAYSFSGETLLYTDLPPSDPQAAPGVARIIIRYDASFRKSQDILYELPFL